MIEYYNNLSSIYLNKENINKLDCEFDYNLNENLDFSYFLKEYQTKRMHNKINYENIEKNFEEAKNCKETSLKNKSIINFTRISDDDLLEFKKELLDDNQNQKENNISNQKFNNGKFLNFSLMNSSLKNKNQDHNNFNFLKNIKTPKKILSFQAENNIKTKNNTIENCSNNYTFNNLSKCEREKICLNNKNDLNIDNINISKDKKQNKNLKCIKYLISQVNNETSFLKINENKEIYGDNLKNESEDKNFLIKKFLVEKILRDRKNSVNRIISFYRFYKKEQLRKREKLIEEILKIRRNSTILIQSTFRSFIIRKNIKNILKNLEENFIFIYDYNKNFINKNSNINVSIIEDESLEKKSNFNLSKFTEEPNQDIKLLLINKKCQNSEILKFEYSRILNAYILIFKKKGLIRRNYKVNFIVNGNIILDPRFKLDTDNDGQFYNVIESNMLLIKNKIKSYENTLKNMALFKSKSEPLPRIKFNYPYSNNDKLEYIYGNKSINSQENKYWEDIFKIKILNDYKNIKTNSISDASENNDVDKIFTFKSSQLNSCQNNKNTQQLSKLNVKSCLKNQSSHNFMPIKKSVSFNDNVKISFFSI